MAVGDGVPDAVGLSLSGQLAHQLQRKGNGTAQTVAGGDVAIHHDLFIKVIVASAMGRRELVSSHKIHLTADALAEEVDYSDVDMVVLPGGIPGTPNLAANKTVTETCAAFAKAVKRIPYPLSQCRYAMAFRRF